MCPFFYNKEVPIEAVPQHMLDYLKRTGRKRGDGRKLTGALSAKKILLYAPLLRWYLEHGAVITNVYRTIDYQPTKIFTWFMEQVTEARRTGDVEKSKALLAEVFKLLGNSGYGKLIEALERQTNIIYTKDEKVVDRALRSACFRDLDEIGQAYELERRKPRVTIKRSNPEVAGSHPAGVKDFSLILVLISNFFFQAVRPGGKLCRAVLFTSSTHTYTLHVYLFHNQKTISGRNSCISTGKASNA